MIELEPNKIYEILFVDGVSTLIKTYDHSNQPSSPKDIPCLDCLVIFPNDESTKGARSIHWLVDDPAEEEKIVSVDIIPEEQFKRRLVKSKLKHG